MFTPQIAAPANPPPNSSDELTSFVILQNQNMEILAKVMLLNRVVTKINDSKLKRQFVLSTTSINPMLISVMDPDVQYLTTKIMAPKDLEVHLNKINAKWFPKGRVASVNTITAYHYG